MTNTVNFIRTPTLKGTQNIAGIWFPAQWFDSVQRRRLLIKYWFLGCSIYQFKQGDLLKFSTTKMLNCDGLEGWPLIFQNGILCSTFLPDKFELKVAYYDLVLVSGNAITSYSYDDAIKIDPAQWVDLDKYQLFETEDYTIEVVYDDLLDFTEDGKPIGQIFDGKIPSPSPKMMRYINEQREKSQQKNFDQQTNSSATNAAEKRKPFPLWIYFVFTFIFIFILLRLLAIFRYKNSDTVSALQDSPINNNYQILATLLLTLGGVILFAMVISMIIKTVKYAKAIKRGEISNKIKVKTFAYKIKSSDLPQTYNPNSSPLPARQNREKQKPSRWRNYLSLFSIVSKLSHLIALRQGNYIETMLKKFEQGNLEDALRYAIPINNNSPSKGQAFGVPKPRNKLSLSESVYGNSSSIYLEEKLQKHLQVLYQQSFEKLAKQDRVEEAVFVLVELLNNLDEGLEFLMQRKRYKQAMELAIARDAKPELIIKLCCLANDWNKAVMIARRDNAFANAILMLEKDQPEIVDRLRLEWANALADRAEWLAAIDVIWPLPKYRYLAEEWFNNIDKLDAQAIDAKAIVKRLILMPESIDKLEDRLTEIKNNPDFYQKRLGIAQQILEQQQYIENLRSLLRVLINNILADVVTYPNEFTKVDIAKLIELTQDKSLKIDMPNSSLTLARHKPLLESNRLLLYICPEAGYRSIYHMAVLTDNNYLLALGEAGIIKVDRQGKQLAHFMIPAERLVISHNRLQVLALVKRNNYYRIHKLDLSTGKFIDLGVVQFQQCHWTFDGINWTIVNNNCIEVINIGNTLAVVWRVDLSPNSVLQIAIKDHQEAILTVNPENCCEAFYYSIPERRLINRRDIENDGDNVLLSDELRISYLKYDYITNQLSHVFNKFNYEVIPLTMSEKQFKNLHVLAIGQIIALCVNQEDSIGYNIHLYHPDSNQIKMIINWHSSMPVSGFCIDGEYCFFDKQGRVLHVNVKENKVTSFSI
ncbi:bpX6 domain-containing protein [Gilliamella sp. WF3-4]|uniref:bpX6 domain-containing protein n=1 Tax=Gilliamella sp. WF3-4 TaxID=3120255 RepID=UPI00080EE3BD|nr:bpX6 domain-containing protein [Gilliamella apicola]OCG18263.1 hypothetical protein A9G47_07135 [Gilliamella apicola]